MRNQLTEAFGAAGTVVNVRLPTDRETGELKGIGFVEFDSADAKVSARLRCRASGRRDARTQPACLVCPLARYAFAGLRCLRPHACLPAHMLACPTCLLACLLACQPGRKPFCKGHGLG